MKHSFIEEYWKHTALNLGQAARDIRYFYYHPEANDFAKEGSLKHLTYSYLRRVRSLGNNLFYSLIPPHWHHTQDELDQLVHATAQGWFLHGFAPWKYPDPLPQKKRAKRRPSSTPRIMDKE